MSELARITWREARDALGRARLALLPAGSLEQHGPHLTLDTDLAVAEELSRRLKADLGDDAVLCPSLPYGLSEHHMDFPGTLTLRPETFIHLVLDVIESLNHWGVRRVLVVNGHGGNIDALRLVARTARRDHGSLVASLMWAELAADEIARRVESPTYGHACEVETSVAMVLSPASVRADAVARPEGRVDPDPLVLPQGPLVDRPTWLREWTADGALGDPRRASLELGQGVVEVAYQRALSFARGFAEQPVTGEDRAP